MKSAFQPDNSKNSRIFSVRDTENSRLLDVTQSMENDEENEDEKEDEKMSKYCNPLIFIIIFLVVLVILMLSLVVFWKLEVGESCPKNCPELPNECKTAECVALAGTLLSWQNTSVDPCEDFYEYTCGKYHEHTANEGTRMHEKDEIVLNLIKHFILKNQSTNSRSEIALKLLYKSCTESHRRENIEDHIERVQVEIFQNIQKIGKWPIADKNWKESDFDLNEMLTNMAKLHMQDFGFFETGLVEYPINGSPKQLIIRPSLDRFSISQEKLAETIFDVLRFSGHDALRKNLLRDVQESLDLDKELGNFYISLNSWPISASLEEVQSAVPNIDFERIMKSFLHPEHGNWTRLKAKISSGRFDSFFNSKNNISAIISRTKPRILANYLILKYIEYAQFFYALAPISLESEYDTCLMVITSFLPRAAIRVFVRNHFKKENKAVASELVDVIKKAYIEMIQNSTWLHEETRKKAILKVETLKKVIGYTEEYEKEGALDAMFETNLRISESIMLGNHFQLHLSPQDSFFTLMTKINRFKTEQLMEYVSSDSLFNPVEKTTTANAYYYHSKNLLSVLVPFLDKPLFDFQYPKYVAMAGVGRILAHEIGHAFDTKGRHFNELGEKTDWWTPEDSVEYDKRVMCLRDQFENFKDPSYGGRQNDSETASEMVADALGLEASWIALESMDMSKEESLVKFGNEDFRKLFFQVAALDFCSPTRIDTHHPRFLVDLSHPTNRFRINGAFSNLESFAKTYECPVGSRMNPEKKCRMF
ncbi:hypothetical protein B9Z55_007194 [Caenorhabditis nigoni]|uniref:Peptidase M13 C-terminal domain-containing protein n=2 Tax=Caenorhabditis nigoni TaxID=1611254 RepID=A0A2G5V8H7_9PELO|nr:hypothetical protein B9Z55_007194 [Caenorhabditis nigoni]